MANEAILQVKQSSLRTSEDLSGQRHKLVLGNIAATTDERQELPRERQVSPELLGEEQQTPDNQQSAAMLEEAVEELNFHVQNISRELRFNIDEATGRTIIKVIDSESKDVIREIPPSEITRMRRVLGEYSNSGLLMNVEV